MKDRIAWVRKQKNISQGEMADTLGLSRNYISLIENGNRTPSDRTISDICRIFGVDEAWLRDGIGEPFREKSREEELAAVFGSILAGQPSQKNAFISAVAQLPDELFPVFVKAWIEAAEEMKKSLEQQ